MDNTFKIISDLKAYIRALEAENKELRMINERCRINRDREYEQSDTSLNSAELELLILQMNNSVISDDVRNKCRNEIRRRGYDPDVFDAAKAASEVY